MVAKSVFLIGSENGKIQIIKNGGNSIFHELTFTSSIPSYQKMDSVFPCFHQNKIYIFLPGSYVIYDGTSYSELATITGFNAENQEILAAQSFDNKIAIIVRHMANQIIDRYEAAFFENGTWSEFKTLPIEPMPNILPEQISSTSIGGEARIIFSHANLSYFSSIDSFERVFTILADGNPIHQLSSPYTTCAVSSELSSIDFIYACPTSTKTIGIFLQENRFSTRKIIETEFPVTIDLQNSISLDIFRQSKNNIILRCGVHNKEFINFTKEINISTSETTSWMEIKGCKTSSPKFVSAWPKEI